MNHRLVTQNQPSSRPADTMLLTFLGNPRLALPGLDPADVRQVAGFGFQERQPGWYLEKDKSLAVSV